ncbi:uncharacterized protein LOC144153302 [Haemaphysalis longicornis]
MKHVGTALVTQLQREVAPAVYVFRCCLVASSRRRPLQTAAIARGITEAGLAEILADQFTQSVQARPPPPPLRRNVTAAVLPEPRVVALCITELTLSAPGIDGVTYQMLRNLDVTHLGPLLRLFNHAWTTGILPAAWLVGLVSPILKVGKPPSEPESYRPVSLTSTAGKVLEHVALARLQWIADQRAVFREQQSGFRRHRCTADSLGDVVSMLEQVRHDKEVAYLLLLDMKAAFDTVPHGAILEALDGLGVVGHLKAYVQAFLAGRTFRVKVGRATSSPRDVCSGVPQGGVLSPFLFNLVLAPLPDCIPAGLQYPVGMAVYADDIAIWTHRPTGENRRVRACLQTALDSVAAFLASRGLVLSEAKTQAFMRHPSGKTARRQAPEFVLNGKPLPWRLQVTYLGFLVDCRLTWMMMMRRAAGVLHGVRQLLARGNGCSHRVALRIYNSMATSAVLYALPLVTLKRRRWGELELDQRRAIRLCLDLPRYSPVAGTYTEAATWTIEMRALQTGLRHIDRLQKSLDGAALLQRFRGRPNSQMGTLLKLYEENIVVPQRPRLEPPLPGTGEALQIATKLPGVRSKRTTPHAAIYQEVATLLHEGASGRLHVYTDGSVLPHTGTAAAACTAPALGASRTCRLPFPASSTTAELAGLHLAADLLLERAGQDSQALVLTDSRPALLRLREADQPSSSCGHVETSFAAKLHAVASGGCNIRLQWLPSHMGIPGNDAADALAKGAHQPVTPVSQDVTEFDAARQQLAKVALAMHPDRRVVSGQTPRVLPGRLSRDVRSLLLRLRLNCVDVAARLHRQGRRSSPPRLENLLHPAGPDATRRDVFRLLLAYLEATGLAQRL